MRRLRLLSALTFADHVIPAGEEITVDDAEAKTLRGAIGLVEDLGEAEPDNTQAATGGMTAPPATQDHGGAAPLAGPLPAPAAGDDGGTSPAPMQQADGGGTDAPAAAPVPPGPAPTAKPRKSKA